MRAAIGATVLFLATAIGAQQVVWEVTGKKGESEFTQYANILGDIDGDGYEDIGVLATVAPGSPGAGASTADYPVCGIIRAYYFHSGRDGRLLRIRPSVSRCDNRNFNFAPWPVGDMDGDGRADYVTTIIDQGIGFRDRLLQVCNGMDDCVLWSVTHAYASTFGDRIVGGLDLDLDGRPDLIVGAHIEAHSIANPGLYAYSNSGKLLWSRRTGHPMLWLTRFGHDFDGDGVEDFLYAGDLPSRLSVGVTVYSGRTGQPIGTTSVNPYVPCGFGVVAIPDVDGDQVPDIYSPTRARIDGNAGAILSGATLLPIRTIPWQAYLGDYAIAGDFDLDGYSDWAGGLGTRDGRDLMLGFYPPPDGRRGHWTIAAVGRPHPGDRWPVMLFVDNMYGSGQPYGSGLQYLGRLVLMRPPPPGTPLSGAPCRGTLPDAPAIGFRPLGVDGEGRDNARIHLTGAPPGANAVLAVGLSDRSIRGVPLPLDLTPLGFTGCRLLTSSDVLGTTRAGTVASARGWAFFDMPRVRLPLTLHAQWIVLGTGASFPGGVSDAVSWQAAR
jgi:hypothetical protein